MLRSLFCLSALAAAAHGKSVLINNTAPRLDEHGQILDGHDCTIRVLPNGTYVMHTIEYGLCVAPAKLGCDQTPDKCGFRNNHNVTVWTSPDLSSGSWHKVGNAFDFTARPAGLIFRPDAIFNPVTQQWVLWYNQASGGNIYITSVSDSFFGPFQDFRPSNCTNAVWTGGDFHLFVDPADSQGYVIWTGMSSAPNDHKIRVSKLTADMRDVVPDAGSSTWTFAENFTEAPMLFERGGLYYAVFGHCCCCECLPACPAAPLQLSLSRKLSL
jgi:hypothetical protein